MSENQYPVFIGGQSLTASELNDLRAFLHARDRLLGRLVGFGVNAGLGGTVSDTTLTIDPGIAIDQTGEPLLVPEPVPIALAPPDMTPSYDFVDPAAGGFSVVLEAADTVQPSPDCGEQDCAGHAELHTRDVAVRTVAGRVTGTRMDYSSDPLLTVEPIRLALDGTPTPSYTELRDAIAARLTNGGTPLVSAELIARLGATSIAANDSAGIKGYKTGWLNMVLFATLDLLRTEALIELTWDRSTTRPGVVLGWVHQVDGVWVFDCAYRHSWEPPRGFTEAFLGGTCTDPAGTFRDDLEAILAGYAPPEPPAGDPRPPADCPAGSIRIGRRCIPIKFAPPVIPPGWRDQFQLDPIPVIPWPPKRSHDFIDEIYDRPPINVLGEEGFGVTDYLGKNGTDVKAVLDGYIAERGAIADVKVIPVAETETLEGFTLAGTVAPSDTVVFGVDASGTVVSTGRVPAVRNVRTVGSALPAAVAAVADATAVATELRGMSSTLSTRLDAHDADLTTLQSGLGVLRTDFTDYTTRFDPAVFGTRLTAVENGIKSVETLNTRISVLDGKVDVLTRPPRPLIDVINRPDVPIRGALDKPVGARLADFASTTVEALRALPGEGDEEALAAAERARQQLLEAVAPAAPEDPAVVAAAALEVIGTLRTLVKSTGVSEAAGARLDEQVRRIGDLLQ